MNKNLKFILVFVSILACKHISAMDIMDAGFFNYKFPKQAKQSIPEVEPVAHIEKVTNLRGVVAFGLFALYFAYTLNKVIHSNAVENTAEDSVASTQMPSKLIENEDNLEGLVITDEGFIYSTDKN